nr:PREDICTED: protein RD3-like [Lepisosteus oculatus]
MTLPGPLPTLPRVRKLVTEFEPDVHEVSRIFRSVLRDSLEEEEEREERRLQSRWEKRRSKSLSLVSFKSRLRVNPFRGAGSALPEDELWRGEEEAGLGLARRVRSMPEITPLEERAAQS